jgi:hypothetical protein
VGANEFRHPRVKLWLGQPHQRGSWYYACEIDLGYCGALRGAATVLADDPIFGRFCFGGEWNAGAGGPEIVPKDGVRRRFHAMLKGAKLHLELEADRFAANGPIVLSEDLTQARFQLESDTVVAHSVPLSIAGLPTGEYNVVAGGEIVKTIHAAEGSRSTIELPVPAGGRSAEIRIARKEPGAS